MLLCYVTDQTKDIPQINKRFFFLTCADTVWIINLFSLAQYFLLATKFCLEAFLCFLENRYHLQL